MPLQFAETLWLLAGLAVCTLLGALFLFAEKRSRARLREFAEVGLVERLVASHSPRRLWFKNALLLTGVLLLALSLARPQLGANWEKAETRGIDVMIALDTSRSMLAEDISPNRLERSKLAILDLLETIRGDRVGLIAFAGNAFLQCPLTLDYQAFRQTLNALDTDTIPVGGTDVATAIDEAEAYFEETGNERILILITDGEDLEASGVERAREAAGNGTRILAVGVGSTTGELIPVRSADGQRDFLRDESGTPVTTSLDERTLRQIAEVSNGLYAPLGPTGEGLQRIYEFSLAQSPAEKRQEMLQRIPIERYQWPLLAAIVLIIIESLLSTRRRAQSLSKGAGTAVLLASCFLLYPESVRAGAAGEASEAFDQGRFEEAVTLYGQALETEPDNPKFSFNKGVAAYRAGDFETAIASFENSLRKAAPALQQQAFYNLGNSRVAFGFSLLDDQPELSRNLWNAALVDYENALDLDPDYEKADRNYRTLQSTIAAHTYQLTTEAAPPEGGSVTPGASVFHNVPFPIEATAADGWRFGEWQGEGIAEPEAASTSIQLLSDQSITATFVKTWNLNVLSADEEMGTAGKSGTYDAGEAVPITAEGNDYFAFSRWRVDGEAEVADTTQAESTITLSGDTTVTAEFVPAFKLTVLPEPDIGGPAGPSGFFEEYSVVPIQAQPRDGFEWVGWIGDGIKDPTAQQTTISLTADRIAIARMERIWNLVIVPTPEEGGTVEGAGNHPIGSTVPISASPNEGFTFAGWEGPGVADPAAAETEVTVQSSEHTLFARFEQDDSEGDNQQDQQNQDQQQDQDQQNQGNQDQQQENQDQQSGDEESEESESGEQEQPQEQAPPDQEEPPNEGEQEESGNEEDRESAGEKSAPPQQVPLGQMSREEARQLLNALSENEKYLPAGERSREEGESPPASGKNW